MALAAVGGGACGGPENRAATWSYISPVLFQPNCATSSCHSRAAAVAGLDFSDPDRGYRSLTGLPIWIVNPEATDDPGCWNADGTIVCDSQFRSLVVPFVPDQSRLVQMLRARNAPRMPPDRPLSEADIQLVERWILNGARRHDGDAGVAGNTKRDGGDAAADATAGSGGAGGNRGGGGSAGNGGRGGGGGGGGSTGSGGRGGATGTGGATPTGGPGTDGAIAGTGGEGSGQKN